MRPGHGSAPYARPSRNLSAPWGGVLLMALALSVLLLELRRRGNRRGVKACPEALSFEEESHPVSWHSLVLGAGVHSSQWASKFLGVQSRCHWDYTDATAHTGKVHLAMRWGNPYKIQRKHPVEGRQD